jgi:hypothetical protein
VFFVAMLQDYIRYGYMSSSPTDISGELDTPDPLNLEAMIKTFSN